MPTSYQENEILTKVLNSKYFLKSPTSKVLLKFLVQASADKVDIKESIIGMHIYGERYEGDKSNARIRVSVYHLRKKLEQYYKNEGKEDALILTIEKGQYQVVFVNNKIRFKTKGNSKRRIHLAYISVIILFLLIYLSGKRKPNIPVWDSLLSNNKGTVMYIGDVYGYLGRTPTGGPGWLRDFEINSEAAFNRKKEKTGFTDNDLKPAGYTYVTASEVDAVKSLSRLFYKQDKDFSVRLASKIDVKDIKEQNILFAGPIKTNNRFIHIVPEEFSRFKYQDNELFLSNKDNGIYEPIRSVYKDELNTGESSEIAVVTKLEGIYDTQQFLFFSDHDMGVRATIEYFTNIDSLQNFQEFHLKERQNFTAIFLVIGKDRVDLGIKLLDVF